MSDRELVAPDEVPHRALSWLWENRIPLRAITILEGDPATGKSRIIYDLAARVTSGSPMPLSDDPTEPAGAVLLGAEDDVGSTVKSVLAACGADFSRIRLYDKTRFVVHPLRIPDDMTTIRVALDAVNARLLVIDPITAFLDCNMTNDQAVRAALTPLLCLAEEKNLAVVIVQHLTKAGGSNHLYRGAGSIGLIAAARSALLATNDPSTEDEHQHLLLQVKTNLSSAPSVVYRTVVVGGTVVVEWKGTSVHTAKTLSGSGYEHKALLQAQHFLYQTLASGPVLTREVKASARDAFIAERTLRRAKDLLHIKAFKKHLVPWGPWYWTLPDDEALLQPFKDHLVSEITDELVHGEPVEGQDTSETAWEAGGQGATDADDLPDALDDDGQPGSPTNS
jgi:hypothetical protein